MTQHTLRVLTKRTQEQMKGLHTGILPLLTDIRSSFILQLAILKWLETRCTSVAYQGFFEVSIYQLYTVILTQESTDLFKSKIWCIASINEIYASASSHQISTLVSQPTLPMQTEKHACFTTYSQLFFHFFLKCLLWQFDWNNLLCLFQWALVASRTRIQLQLPLY